MASDLVTIQRAKMNSFLAALNTSNPQQLANIISAASLAVQAYTYQDWTQTAYSEYKNGGIYKRNQPLLLRKFPVIEVTRFAVNPIQVILVTNVGGSTTQRATVQTIGDAAGINTVSVQLNWVSSAVPGTVTFNTNAYPTIQAMVNAINGAGNGFSATVYQSSSSVNTTLVASADLRPTQGASSCINQGAGLRVWLEQVTNYPIGWCDGSDDGADGGGFFGSGYGYTLDPETGEVYGRFPRGDQMLRIDYTAGYAAIPQDIQEAVVQMCVWLYQSGRVNTAFKSAHLGAASYEMMTMPGFPPMVKTVLDQHRAIDRTIYR